VGGSYHTLSIDSNGIVYAVGVNSDGQLGDGTNTDKVTPVVLSSPPTVVSISAGSSHSLFVDNLGNAYSSGQNGFSQLGDGSTTSLSSPFLIPGLAGIVKASAGAFTSHWLTTTGSVYAVGSNSNGQIGDGTNNTMTTPSLVIASGVSDIASGQLHTIFLNSDGSVNVCGNGASGQLGLGIADDVYSPTPITVLPMIKVKGVVAGKFASLFLTTTSDVWATGTNNFGQLGLSSGTVVFTATQSIFSNIVGMDSYGDGSSLFVISNGSIVAIGNGAYGTLGTGTETSQMNPVTLVGPIGGALGTSRFANAGFVLGVDAYV
jgi:alpha-tubulin suppressor-like RCC1 family protein